MENFDLDLDNYTLDDLLNLFHIDYNLSENQMKKAKTIALKTHPDKSGLPKEVFLFFSEAYKLLLSIYKYKYKKEQEVKNVDYKADKNKENTLLLDKLKDKNPKEFNRWFNELFEKVKVKDDETDEGYGDWLKSDKDIDNIKVNNASAMANEFEKKKERTAQLTVYNGIKDMEISSGSNLMRERLQIYSTDIFSKLPYQDLKKAHTETVVPTTKQDYLSKKKFANVNEYVNHREKTMSKMPSLQQSKKLIRERNNMNNKTNTQRAYNMLKRDEEIKIANKEWWRHLKQLEN